MARFFKSRHSDCKMFISSTSCPTDRGDRLKAVSRLMCQLFCRSISMMLQACLLLQHLPLLQEVIHIPFSYSLLFFLLHFLSAPVGAGLPILSPCFRGTLRVSNVCDDGSFSSLKECRRSLASEGVAVCGVLHGRANPAPTNIYFTSVFLPPII